MILMRGLVSTLRKYKTMGDIIFIMIFGACLLFTWFLIRDVYTLTARSYIINPENLVRVDSIATSRTSWKHYGEAPGNGRPEIIFITENGQRFRIAGDSYQSITYHNELSDLISKRGLIFSLYTDKKGFEYYKKGNRFAIIDIYQVIIRGHAYINIYKANELTTKRLTWRIVVWLISIGLIIYSIYIYIKRIKKIQQSSAKIIKL